MQKSRARLGDFSADPCGDEGRPVRRAVGPPAAPGVPSLLASPRCPSPGTLRWPGTGRRSPRSRDNSCGTHRLSPDHLMHLSRNRRRPLKRRDEVAQSACLWAASSLYAEAFIFPENMAHFRLDVETISTSLSLHKEDQNFNGTRNKHEFCDQWTPNPVSDLDALEHQA